MNHFYLLNIINPLHITSQAQNSALNQINEDLSLAESFAHRVEVCTFPSFDLDQARNFIFERARPFSFCKGHFHWKTLKSVGIFYQALRARPRATEAKAFM